MPQEILTVLKAYARSPQAMTEGMTQIVYSNLGNPRPTSGSPPSVIVDPHDAVALVREYVLGMLTALRIDHALGYSIEHNNPFLTVLRHLLRKQEYRTI